MEKVETGIICLVSVWIYSSEGFIQLGGGGGGEGIVRVSHAMSI